MRSILQRVAEARVRVAGEVVGEIGPGLLVLLGIAPTDGPAQREKLLHKLLHLRIFPDDSGKPNRNLQQTGGGILVVSQFTLYANTQKGHRPSYTRSAPPDVAEAHYDAFLAELRQQFSGPVATGHFGAAMHVELVNDGPYTLVLDTEQPDF